MDTRRGVGESKIRNSLVGERAVGFLEGEGVGMRVPLRLESARGSIDLRRRVLPRGTEERSTAYSVSSIHLFFRSQLGRFVSNTHGR